MSYQDDGGWARDGLTIRDYFANKAQDQCPINQYDHAGIAEFCYKRADAMLEARKQ